MSNTANASTPRKPASRQSELEAAPEEASKLLQSYTALMRRAGSPNGAWNPLPDQHLTGLLREDVVLSSNEMKFVALVVASCIRRDKPKGRTEWGFTATGKPLVAAEIERFFGWDSSNTLKHSKRPLAYGFVRLNPEVRGQFGLGARVDGTITEPENTDLEEEGEVVCTYHLPQYLSLQYQQLSELERPKFIEGWEQIKSAAQRRFAAEKKRLYQLEQDDLQKHCKAFGLTLKLNKQKVPKPKGKGEYPEHKPKVAEEKEEQNEWYVHTTPEEFVQNDVAPLYNASDGSVHTTHIRKHSKAINKGVPSSSSVVEPEWIPENEPTTTPLLERSLESYGNTDPEVAERLISNCKNAAPACTLEEIIHFIHTKGVRARNAHTNPIGLLLIAVPKCFTGDYRSRLPDKLLTAPVEEERKPLSGKAADTEEFGRRLMETMNDAKRKILG